MCTIILYADMLHSHDAHTDASQSCRLCCLALTVSWQLVYLSSAAHLEPVFMHKGEVYTWYCTGKFVFFLVKG